MLSCHPNPVRAWDKLDEKTVQTVISSLTSMDCRGEVTYGRGRVDFLTSRYLIEIKKASAESGKQKDVARVHTPLGQILYYAAIHEATYHETLTPVIMVYGSNVDKYLEKTFQIVRRRYGVRLWILASLRDGLAVDADTENIIDLKEL